jgi:hypothetical protein
MDGRSFPMLLPFSQTPKAYELTVCDGQVRDAERRRTCSLTEAPIDDDAEIRGTESSRNTGLAPPTTAQEDSEDAAAEPSIVMGSHWLGRAPPDHVALDLRKLSVDWLPDCTYGEASCPELRLSGVDCPTTSSATPKNDGACHYVCATNASFALPATADFRVADRRWSTTLSHPGQTLVFNGDPEQRTAIVNFNRWERMPFYERTERTGVVLELPSGRTSTYDFGHFSPATSRELAIPNYVCDTPIRYRNVGNARALKADSTYVRDGRIELEPPTCDKIECVGFTSMLGLGLLARTPRQSLPSTQIGSASHVWGNYLARYSPWGAWWSVEFGYTAWLGSHEFVRAPPTDTAVREGQLSWAPYGRLGYRVAFAMRTPDVRPLAPSLQAGAGIEAGYGHVLSLGSTRGVGGDLFVTPVAFLRAGSWGLNVRMLFFEELKRIDSGTGDSHDPIDVLYVGYDLSYQFDTVRMR